MNILVLEMKRDREHSHIFQLHSNIDNKCCGRMPEIKITVQ
jgi:hypothetical protein